MTVGSVPFVGGKCTTIRYLKYRETHDTNESERGLRYAAMRIFLASPRGETWVRTVQQVVSMSLSLAVTNLLGTLSGTVDVIKSRA